MLATGTNLGNNIKALREERGISQDDLAKAMNISRPSISTWENGKSEPSASQLISLAKILNVSLDMLAGNTHEAKSVVVVDTSVLIKRPMIIDELILKFDEVLIPEVVISELNNIKDGTRRQNKQRAWLAMVNLKNAVENDAIQYCKTPKTDEINDVRIVAVAVERARKSIADKVYVFSDDIYFSYLIIEQRLSNLEALTFPAYAEKFKSETERDTVKSQNFFSLVKAQKLEEVKRLDKHGVDVNMLDPETGLTPLIQAIRNRHFAMVEYLIGLPNISLDKADQQKYNFTPLLHAAQLKETAFEIFKLLIERGADYELGSGGNNAGNTPLMVCAWGGFKQGIEHLLAQTICTNQQDTNGYTALIKACIRGQYEIGLLLLPQTDIAIRSRENKKAEDYIIRLNEPLASKLIKEMGKKKEVSA